MFNSYGILKRLKNIFVPDLQVKEQGMTLEPEDSH